MKKFLFVLLFMGLVLMGCNGEKVFEESIEYIDTAEGLNELIEDDKVRGGDLYTFIDLRGNKGVYDLEKEYPMNWSYFTVRLGVFENAPWGNTEEKQQVLLNLVNGKNTNYPIVLIDYDGSYVEEAKNLLQEKGFQNIKMFRYGFFSENGYKNQMGEDFASKVINGDAECDC